MRRVGLLLVCVLCGGTLAPARAEPPSVESLAERLGSPVAEVRQSAWEELGQLDPATGAACVDTWASSASPRLRAAAHAVRGRALRAQDIPALVDGLADTEATVARAAADALLTAARADRLGAEPPLPRSRALPPRALRALMLALEETFNGADASDLDWVLRLGEGAVGAVGLVAMDAKDTSRPRRTALALLARFGGLCARRAIAAGGPTRWAADMGVWCDVVLAAGAGPGFEEIERWLDGTVLPAELAEEGFRGRRGRPAWRHPRSNMAEVLAQFAEGREERVQAVLRDWVETQGGGWWPPGRIQAVRAFLAVVDPDDDDLEEIIGASIPPFNRNARMGGLHDGLAEILRLVAPWRETSEALREEARRVANRTLPPIHHVWLRYLADGKQAEGLLEETVELLTAVPPHPQRQRLAAFLLDQLGSAPPAALDAAAASDDGGLRAWAVHHRVRVPGEAGDQAATEAMRDADARVLLAGALPARVALDEEARLRLVELAATGETRETRRRAAQALAGAGRATSDDNGPLDVLADAPLDDRLRWRQHALEGLR